ncbi:MAG: 3-deoxy-7-phosphoheptulonate synthase [Gammaproteobacteria bacterium]|nr:3-deoxy-7-phosphoheptulonate synthase [Gammaproteobacteria bacterium]
MQYTTDDVRIAGLEEVLAPNELTSMIPLNPKASTLVYSKRLEASSIVHGIDERLLCIVGPCSIHDPKSAMEYAEKLSEQSKTYKDSLCIVMRVYFEKPRTTVGWKGLLNDPHLNNSYDINEGLKVARQLVSDITDLELGIGTEYLDPITPQYLGDLITWSAIGARTTESQVHRQLASGLSCPVGFKNSTHGNVQIAVDAVKSANHSHMFLSVTKEGHSAIFQTKGNPDCHVILRGGGGSTNYDAASVESTKQLLEKSDVANRIMIDMSHANSEKDHVRQKAVCTDLCEQLKAGSETIMGVMIESHLVEGNQSIGNGTNLTYGQSITDACLGWEDTERCLEELANAVAVRG